MRDNLQVVRIPAGVDAATVVQLHAFGNRAAQQLPSEPVGVAVLCLGDATVGGRRPGEPPAGAQLRVRRSEDSAVKQAFQL